jgi:hypothetical protein
MPAKLDRRDAERGAIRLYVSIFALAWRDRLDLYVYVRAAFGAGDIVFFA